MNRLGFGIITCSVATAGCLLLLMLLTYLSTSGWFDFKSISSQTWIIAISFTAIMFLGSIIFAVVLFIDSNRRDWNVPLQQVLFKRVLFATFPIGNVIYYLRVLKGGHRERLVCPDRKIAWTKRLSLDVLAFGTILLIITTLLSFTVALCSPILFNPFPAKMLLFVKLSFGFLIATIIFFGCFHLMIVVDLTARALTTPDKVPANLRYLPDTLRPGRGTFTYYFKFLRKEFLKIRKEDA